MEILEEIKVKLGYFVILANFLQHLNDPTTANEDAMRLLSGGQPTVQHRASQLDSMRKKSELRSSIAQKMDRHRKTKSSTMDMTLDNIGIRNSRLK